MAGTTGDKGKPSKPSAKPSAKKGGKPKEPVLLSGGNPQIPKDFGSEPVQAYIAAMPGWKEDTGRKLDRLIERTVPTVVTLASLGLGALMLRVAAWKTSGRALPSPRSERAQKLTLR